MGSGSGSVTGEPERKRQRRFPSSHTDSSFEPSEISSTSSTVSSTSPSSAAPSLNVVSPRASSQAEAEMASTATDPHNLRGVRSKAGLEMLQGDHFIVKVGFTTNEQKTWVLPRRLLTGHSPFFANISSEKAEGLVCVGEAAAFELFAQWLYLGELGFDGVNVSSETLARTWILGDEFLCPAFKDHVMVQLIKSHHERGIKPRTFREIYEFPISPRLNLRKWAIDQFHAKITYGYTGYDDQKEDDPSDKDTWKEYANDVKGFSQDFLKVSLDAGQGVGRVKKPWENGQQYMEVLRYAEIGVCKEEGKSMKVEATLTKAEGR